MDGRFHNIEDARDKGASVLIAMSGGVDSAVAGLLVKRTRLRAIGLTMKNYCYGDVEVPDRSCCSVEAIQDARRECDRLGIPHQVADVEGFFTHEVIDNFISEYENARTPNPCVRCNSIVRFQTLIEYADKLGVDYVATGHYARIFESTDGRKYLARSTNRRKDQSYFLSGVRGDVLDRVIFPLGDYDDKATVRAMAEGASMDVAAKKESQEVCFVPDGTLRSFLESRDVSLESGDIENVGGEVLGTHSGLAAYTVGQRRHVGVATGTPQYVLGLDAERNVLVVGDEDQLRHHELSCSFAWFDPSITTAPAGVTAQIRYRHQAAPVRSITIDGTVGRVEFVDPQKAICPGQTIAFYRGELVVASGVIDEAGTS